MHTSVLEEFSDIPYLVSLLNYLLYTWYDLPFVSSNNILVTISDGSGVGLDLICVCLYLAYSRPVHMRIFFFGIPVTELVCLWHSWMRCICGGFEWSRHCAWYSTTCIILDIQELHANQLCRL
jgi:hypothetical protein